MVFSIFGRKPPKPAPRPGAVADRPAAKPEAPPAQPKEEPSRIDPAKDRPLDFTVEERVADNHDFGTSNIVIHERAALGSPVIEEAAILFANGQDEQALAALEAAVASDELGGADEQVWWMLFDVYQALGRREDFEARSIDYVVKFEKSPPSWSCGEGAAGGAGFGVPSSSLSGALNATVAKQLEPIQRLMARNPVVRVDVGKLKDADAAGCSHLLQFLREAKKAKHEVLLQNAPSLVALLQDRIEVGRRDDEDIWMLLLELHQHSGEQERFEDLALNYAVTFEQSPPSWENRPKPRATPTAPAAQSGAGADAYYLRGEIAAANVAAVQDVAGYIAANEAVALDLSQLRRMDFVSAGTLLNVLTPAARAGKKVVLRGASSLVSALLHVVGVTQIASVERRKY